MPKSLPVIDISAPVCCAGGGRADERRQRGGGAAAERPWPTGTSQIMSYLFSSPAGETESAANWRRSASAMAPSATTWLLCVKAGLVVDRRGTVFHQVHRSPATEVPCSANCCA